VGSALRSLQLRSFRAAADLVSLWAQQPRARGQFRMVSLLKRVQPKQAGFYTVRRQGLRWRLDPESRGLVTMELFYFGRWEAQATRWMRRHVRPGWTCFDVGANIGYYAVLLAAIVGPGGRVYAFEPVSRFAAQVADNKRVNGFDQITVEQMALSAEESEITIYVTKDTAAVDPQHWNRAAAEAERVTCTTLDRYVEQRGLAKVDFLKVDLDGHEPEFLRGGIETLRRHRPLMLVEVVPECLEGGVATAAKLVGDIQKLGYGFSTTGERPLRGGPDDVLQGLAGDPTDSSNLVCVPQTS
jgi:FkbM family methyltransferase